MAYSTYLKYARALIDVVVERDIEGQVEQEIATLQGLLADNEQAAAAVQDVLDERRGIVRGEVTSAEPLSDSTRTSLLEAVGQMTGRGARLDFQQDEALIGGIKLQIGSTVFDGSVQTALETLKKELASR